PPAVGSRQRPRAMAGAAHRGPVEQEQRHAPGDDLVRLGGRLRVERGGDQLERRDDLRGGRAVARAVGKLGPDLRRWRVPNGRGSAENAENGTREVPAYGGARRAHLAGRGGRARPTRKARTPIGETDRRSAPVMSQAERSRALP